MLDAGNRRRKNGCFGSNPHKIPVTFIDIYIPYKEHNRSLISHHMVFRFKWIAGSV